MSWLIDLSRLANFGFLKSSSLKDILLLITKFNLSQAFSITTVGKSSKVIVAFYRYDVVTLNNSNILKMFSFLG